MTNRLNDDAWEIRKLIREAEGVTDDGIIACARLKQAMIGARRNPAFAVGAGQTALLRLNRAEQNMAAAASELLRVHAELNTVARVTAGVDDGVPTIILGDIEASEPAQLSEAA